MVRKTQYEGLDQKGKELSKRLLMCKPAGDAAGVEKYALESCVNAVAITELEGNLAYVNKSFLKMWGYDEDQEVLGRPHVEFLEVPDRVSRVALSLRDGARWSGVLTGKRKDCSLFDVKTSISAFKDGTGEPIWIILSFVDISARKRTEDELKKQTLRNELIIETAIDGFFVLDVEGRILEANRAASQILGYSKQELIGLNIKDLEVSENYDEIRDRAKKLMKKRADRFETRNRHKKGWVVDLETRVNFVQMNDDKFYFAFFNDITGRKRAERALTEREKELEQKAKALEEMNTALRVLIKTRDEDRMELEENVLLNIQHFVLTYLEKLKKSKLNEKQKSYVSLMEKNLEDEIVSPLSSRLSSVYLKFTPTEIKISNLVKQGKTTKEIAELLCLSIKTIESHRKSIRGKLSIKNTKTNLRSHLLSLR